MSSLLLLCTAPERRSLWRALLLALLLAITWLALSPAPPPTMDTGWDKANHLMAFGALAFASVWALWPQPRQWGWLILALLVYGVGIEIAQSFLPPREADWHDVVADGLGIALGLLSALPIQLTASRSASHP
ncbi:VanZ family protein [Roseateles asaccharophilus]|uniref:VanZ family protein n=1 Tax=Roseateles asaccharophilus TaxID=582607 RepID=A0ABU2AG02_9BURK|nr:VanZ family protein [Roseateles asaccharophilus]MDR7336159.1 VanZ family protein [Roseateles asaccharophilus]